MSTSRLLDAQELDEAIGELLLSDRKDACGACSPPHSDLVKSLEDVRADRNAAVAELAGMKARLVACEAALVDAQTEAEMGEAELARLKPSGQAADGVERFTPASGNPPDAYTVAQLRDAVIAFVRSDPCQDEPFKNAIANGVIALASKAQGYDTAVAQRGAAMKLAEMTQDTVEILNRKIDEAEEERDAALSDLDRVTTETAGGSLAPDLYLTLGGRGTAETVAKALSERTGKMMAAVADNAALLAVLRDAVFAMEHACDTLNDMDAVNPEEDGPAMAAVERVTAAMEGIEAGAHPGAALLEQQRKAISDLEHMKRQRKHVAALLGATDGGEWQNDWDAPIAKALIRARNEGLEKARKMVANVGLANLASVIEAAREPEQ